MTTATITVEPRHNNVYTIYNVPKKTYSMGSLGGKEFTVPDNNFAFNDLYIDSFKKTVNDDGTCSVNFDAYNCNHSYGIVEVYDENDNLKDAVLLDKYEDANTSITESLFGNVGRLVNLATTGISYQTTIISKKTSVSIDNIPAGGYIKITADSLESPLLGVVNSANIVLNVASTAKEIVASGEENNFVMHDKFLDNLMDAFHEEANMNSLDNFKEALSEAAVDATFKNSESAADFAESLLNSLEGINWLELMGEAALNAGVAGAENIFTVLSGPAGTGLKICFTIGSASNTLLHCMNMHQCMNSTTITVQNPQSNSRTFNKVHVQSSKPIDENIALETYKIVGREYDMLPEAVRKYLGAKECVEVVNISMINDGKETQINSTATITVPITHEMTKYKGKLKVYRVEPDGTMTPMKMSANQPDGCVKFETDHFSIYAIVSDDEDGDINNTIDEPKVTPNNFEDAFLYVSSWAEQEVKEAYELGLVPENLYGKDLSEYIDREDFATIAVKLYEKVSGGKYTGKKTPFTDITNSSNIKAIEAAYDLDIIAGTSETTFEPYKRITREQMATMICRVFKKYAWEGWSLENDFKYKINSSNSIVTERKYRYLEDDDEIANYAKPSVFFLDKHGIARGMDYLHYGPTRIASIDQAIAMSLRSYKVLFTNEVINDSLINHTVQDYKKIYLDFMLKTIKNPSEDPFSTTSAFILTDIDADKTPELFAMSATQAKDDHYYSLEGFFSIKNGEVVQDDPWVKSRTSSSKTLDYTKIHYLPDDKETVEDFVRVVEDKSTGQRAFGMCSVSDILGNVFVKINYDVQTIGASYEREKYSSSLLSNKYKIIDTPIVSIGREFFDESQKRKTLYELLEILCDNYADKTASR